MSKHGIILALDLGVALGVCLGAPGSMPESYSVRLRTPRESADIAFATLHKLVSERLADGTITAVVKEAPISLDGFANLTNSQATVRTTLGYHAIVEAACVAAGVPWTEVHVTTVRKHFLGRGRFADRAEAKAAVVRRCQLLGYMPRDCADDNQADACAVWDWAAAHVARTPGAFHLFGEEAVA
jgi:hypothetical protein